MKYADGLSSFNYRSGNILEAQGIKPMPPKAPDVSTNCDVQIVPQKRKKQDKAGTVHPQVKKEKYSQATSSPSKQVIEINDDSEDEEVSRPHCPFPSQLSPAFPDRTSATPSIECKARSRAEEGEAGRSIRESSAARS